MTISNGQIIVTRHGRVIPIQRVNDDTYASALRAFGVREVVAAAAARGLLQVKVTL